MNIEVEMSKNDELTARKIRQVLIDRWPDLNVSYTERWVGGVQGHATAS